MPTNWRQGDLLSPDDAVTLGVIETAQRDTHRALVISHSCDIASKIDVEPTVELLIGVVVQDEEATAQNGHSIRKLHLAASGDPNAEWIQFGIAERRDVPKVALLEYEPWPERIYTDEQRTVLRRWLAQRYARCEFPDAFINWLKESGVGSRFEELGKRHSAHLVGIYFDLNDDSERDNPDEPYTLGINLVYDAGNAENADSAEQAKQKLEALFKQRCNTGDQWRWIELIYCDVQSDKVFTLWAANTYQRWRFEHRSLDGEPIDTSE